MEQLTSVYERIGEAIGESLESVCSMREEERRELIITLGLEDTVNRIEDRVSRKVKDDPDQGKLTVIQRIAAAIGETVENVTKLPGAEIGQLVRVLGLEDLAAQEDEEHVDSGGSGGGSAVIDVADLSTDDSDDDVLVTSATGPSCSTGAGWGECPVCGQLLPRDKLGLHAMACQGLEGNGGEGLEVNPMEVQSKCGKCGCLVPDLVMEEHSRTCWADNSNKRRIETPMERRSLKEAAGRVVREHHNLSVHEFGSKFAEMFGIELDPRNYGCHEMKDLVIKMSIEFQIFDLQVTDNRLIVNIAQSAIEPPEQKPGCTFLDVIDEAPKDRVLDESIAWEKLNEDLKEGNHFHIVITQVIDPSKFFFNVWNSLKFGELQKVMDQMDDFYFSSEGDRYAIRAGKDLREGAVIAARYRETGWHRAVVLRVLPHGMLHLSFVDYGTIDHQKLSSCRYLRKRWLKPAGQAMEAHLYGIVPADGRTAYPGTAARNAIVSMTGGEPGTVVAFIKSGVGRKEVHAHPVPEVDHLYEEVGLGLTIMDYGLDGGPKGRDIAKELIKMGLADPAPIREIDVNGMKRIQSNAEQNKTPPPDPMSDTGKTESEMAIIMAKVDKLVGVKDDMFQTSKYLKLLRLNEINLKLAHKALLEHGDIGQAKEFEVKAAKASAMVLDQEKKEFCAMANGDLPQLSKEEKKEMIKKFDSFKKKQGMIVPNEDNGP